MDDLIVHEGQYECSLPAFPKLDNAGVLVDGFSCGSFVEQSWFGKQHILIDPNGDKAAPLEYYCSGSGLDLGVVTESSKFYVCIFNADRENPNDVVGFDIMGDGITVTEVTGTPPLTTGPLQSAEWLVCVEPDGAPQIDVSIGIELGDGRTEDLEISGLRSKSWPFRMCWDPRPVESFQYCTDVIESYDRTEQRIALKDRPDFSQRATYLVKNEDVGLLDACIFGWQGQEWLVGNWACATELETAVSIGDTEIFVDTSSGRYEVGSDFVLWASTTDNISGTIADVQPDRIVASSAIIGNFNPPAYVMPGFRARMPNSLPVARATKDAARVTIEWNGTDASRDFLTATPTTFPTLSGYPLLDLQGNWSNGVNDEFVRALDFCENRTGTDAYRDRTDMPCVVHSNEFCFTSKREVHEYLAWWNTIKGRWGCFWRPSFNCDITITEPGVIADDAQIILIKNIGASFFFQNNQKKWLRFRFTDGREEYREIIERALVDAANEAITLAIPMGFDWSAEELYSVEFVTLYRFESDTATVNWETNGCARIRQNMRLVRLPDDQLTA